MNIASSRLVSLVKRLLRLRQLAIHFTGCFSSYQQALSLCTGYESQLILDKVLASTLSVLSGEGVAERDGFILYSPTYSLSVISGLLIASSRNSGRISVLDFGGSLGSSFFQHLDFLKFMPTLAWNVVEQPHFVAAGRSKIVHENLFFYGSINECLSANTINVCLLSGVLQCIPDPFDVLKSILSIKPDVIILDRTPYLHNGENGYYAIQHVPAGIYPASYPSRFFVRSEIHDLIFAAGYSLISELPAVDNLAPYANWLGHVFVSDNVLMQ